MNDIKFITFIWLFKDLNINYINDYIKSQQNINMENNQKLLKPYYNNILKYWEDNEWIYYMRYKDIIWEKIKKYLGYLYFWKEPWFLNQKINYKIYKMTFQCESQTLLNDLQNKSIKKEFIEYNNNNIFTDSLVFQTKSNGYYIGNIYNKQYYSLNYESPKKDDLKFALKRGSMSVDFRPRTAKLYYTGGWIMGMTINDIMCLNLHTMKLNQISKLKKGTAYHSMTFFPDSLGMLL